jgi:formylglycine-generating enzyme required for sulfatase activity
MPKPISYLTLLLVIILSSCSSRPQSTELNIAGIQFLKIPAGSFTMGATKGSADEQPARSITLSHDFWLAKFELTQAQWKQFMGQTIHQQRDKANKEWSLRGIGPQHPIYYVSWDECQELINKLNKKYSNLVPKGYVLALPTEAQWEYSCRANGPSRPTGELADLAWFDGNSDEQSHPVGQKKPNAWGLYDMYGNVWEWCTDHYDHYDPKEKTNPTGPKSGEVHASRGVSWHEGAGDCYVSKRDWYSADGRLYNLGLRLAIVPQN